MKKKQIEADKTMPAVCSKRCNQCLFSSAKIVSKERKQQIIEDCLREDRPFLCHKGTIAGYENVYCRGWVDEYPGFGQSIRLATALGILGVIDTSTMLQGENGEKS